MIKEEELIVRRIKDGTVIDHISPGSSLNVLKVLGITGEEGITVALVMNVPSRKMGKKDIVKIEGRELTQDQVDKIALISPDATINIVRDYRVVEKRKVSVPAFIRGIIRCPNPMCITNQQREAATPTFRRISDSPLVLRCEYCGAILERKDILDQFR
ncbi:MAG: aspartate carbamoyltransferase regulatory subunit [Candidatus Methanodesulfokora sp.]|jgi:aspartate carbamoyltransferase regulatory subunit|nr:MAG: aspartate carbamoyltransferase regulatory subunit [Candidatus Korarchaeota archaeon]